MCFDMHDARGVGSARLAPPAVIHTFILDAVNNDADSTAGLTAATERFFARIGEVPARGRRVLPDEVVISCAGIVFSVSFLGGLRVWPGGSDRDGARIELAEVDWLAIMEGATTVTELMFGGRLKLFASDTWRGEYARFFNLVRIAQGRPVL